MAAAPLPADEAERLAALAAVAVLDTLPEADYDELTRLAAHICGTPISLVSLLDADRQWFKSRVGLDATETPRDMAFCAHAILETGLFVVPDAAADGRFADNPLVVGGPLIRFYAGAPLTTDRGHSLGTLCVIDRVPRALTAAQLAALSTLARQVVAQFELRRRVAEAERTQAVLREDVTQRKELERRMERYQQDLEAANAKLRVLSTTDGLTGVRNRAAFNDRLAEEFERARRYDHPLSLLLLDVDHFKSFNDTFGHPAGDGVLQEVVRLVAGAARGTDVVARYGGEEFAVVLPDTDFAGAMVLAERVRRAVANGDWVLRSVTVSIGVATLSADAADPAALVREADVALYDSKRNGRNRASHGSGSVLLADTRRD